MSSDVQLTVRLPHEVNRRLERYISDNPEWSKTATIAHALDVFLPRLRNVAPPGAGQDAASGRAGYEFGMSAGRKIAEHYGRLVSPTASEFEWKGRRYTVRTAQGRNTQWGCLDSLRERVDGILCAYTKDGTHFQVWELSPLQWANNARPASKGHKLHGKLTLVRKSDVERIGTEIEADLILR